VEVGWEQEDFSEQIWEECCCGAARLGGFDGGEAASGG
jgi:hypothetical protein